MEVKEGPISRGNLATMHRPKYLNDMIGNDHIKKIIQGFFNMKRFPIIMICGGTGNGKTTCGRIIARYLLCKYGTAKPDCDCKGCKPELENHPDYQEMDIGEERGIDAMRKMKHNAQFLPMLGANRVFLMDECHALSGPAASAVLKLLEEPPARSTFILCTTDPQKVLPTIRGRCKRIDVRTPTYPQLARQLAKIAKREGVKLTNEHKPILKEIHSISGGHVRNAIQMLETLIAAMNSGGEVTTEELVEIFVSDAEAQTQLMSATILTAILQGRVKDVIKAVFQVEDVRGLLHNTRFLLDVIIQRHAGGGWKPPPLLAFIEQYGVKKPNLHPIMHLGTELSRVESEMNLGASDAVLRYVFINLAIKIETSMRRE